jgi:hypothetical protein
LQFLTTSCREYDSGNLDEAIRIATSLRVIFHNTGASTSLLVHLGATGIEILSTCGKPTTNNPEGYWPGLVQIVIDLAQETMKSNPKFNATPGAHRMLPFSAWWDGEVVFYGGGRRIKRKQLVIDAANKDGGAHVDASLPPNYRWMIEGSDASFCITRSDGSRKTCALIAPHLACLRQIAYEVFFSPALLNLAT